MGICSSCCGRRDKTGEREPLLSKGKQSALPPPRSDIERLADALGALQLGKLPSQAQIDTVLFRLLRSKIFDVDGKIRGSGPISRHGRQVVQDVHDVLEALKQFGLDKNGKISDSRAPRKADNIRRRCPARSCFPIQETARHRSHPG